MLFVHLFYGAIGMRKQVKDREDHQRIGKEKMVGNGHENDMMECSETILKVR